MLLEGIPGGAKWRYVWGSCLATVFFIQLFTGLLLVTAYSPGSSTAWASVYFIQYHMDFGWLIRGLHHFGSATMVILLALHMVQVVIAGAHLPPREVNWWLGLALLGLVLALSLTGYLLPWDQKGYWATRVATKIAGNLPVIGPSVSKFLVGGPEYGHHTLSRFYMLHVAVIPPLVIALIIAHVVIFRRHGVTAPKNAKGEGWFWPDQAFRDMVVGLVILGILFAVVLFPHGHAIETRAATDGVTAPAEGPGLWERIKHAGREGRGANLDAPADLSQPYPARPEWYFLSLFQLLKYFEGDQEIIGTVVIPGGIGMVLFILPLLGYRWMRPVGHVVGVLIVVGLLGAVIVLTYQAIKFDRGTSEEAILYQTELAKAEWAAQRAVGLADIGIPPAGPIELLRRDPKTRGEALFGQYCASCHAHGDNHADGDKPSDLKASDLEGFGSYEWIRGLLRNPGDAKYFGRTKLNRMAKWVKNDLSDLDEEEERDVDEIARWLAGHPDPESPEAKTETYQRGFTLFDDYACTECHLLGEGKASQTAPNLAGYGGADWIRGMLMAPGHRKRYGSSNEMPMFLDLEGPDADIVREWLADTETPHIQISDIERELIIRWLTGDSRPVYGGEAIPSSTTR